MVFAPQSKREALHPPMKARARLALALASCHRVFPVASLGSLSRSFHTTPALKLAPASCGVSDPCKIAGATQHPRPLDLLPSSYLDPFIGGLVPSPRYTNIMLRSSLLSGINIQKDILYPERTFSTGECHMSQGLSAPSTVGRTRHICTSPKQHSTVQVTSPLCSLFQNTPLQFHVLQRVGTTIDFDPAYLEEGLNHLSPRIADHAYLSAAVGPRRHVARYSAIDSTAETDMKTKTLGVLHIPNSRQLHKSIKAQGENDAADQPNLKLKHLPRGAYTICDERAEPMTQASDIGATLINVQHGHIQRRHITGTWENLTCPTHHKPRRYSLILQHSKVTVISWNLYSPTLIHHTVFPTPLSMSAYVYFSERASSGTRF
ncbi:hypothetical protein GMOD_00003437 [Pyrenophora seminiperda CCB06]|uniref:Uncharacterized protein n=1 Tax=Pyrenophora seminiperda CCB06 TaxID=1302712 RepID=A0A3M7MIP3_9PLEO|nr:hypothetical protein GMOD_00003437 [Pyrenophora seminiperda CCB06]